MMLAVYKGKWYVVDEITESSITLRGLEKHAEYETVTGYPVTTHITNKYTHLLNFASDNFCQHCGEYDCMIEATFDNGSKVFVCSNCDKVTYK